MSSTSTTRLSEDGNLPRMSVRVSKSEILGIYRVERGEILHICNEAGCFYNIFKSHACIRQHSSKVLHNLFCLRFNSGSGDCSGFRVQWNLTGRCIKHRPIQSPENTGRSRAGAVSVEITFMTTFLLKNNVFRKLQRNCRAYDAIISALKMFSQYKNVHSTRFRMSEQFFIDVIVDYQY